MKNFIRAIALVLVSMMAFTFSAQAQAVTAPTAKADALVATQMRNPEVLRGAQTLKAGGTVTVQTETGRNVTLKLRNSTLVVSDAGSTSFDITKRGVCRKASIVAGVVLAIGAAALASMVAYAAITGAVALTLGGVSVPVVAVKAMAAASGGFSAIALIAADYVC